MKGVELARTSTSPALLAGALSGLAGGLLASFVVKQVERLYRPAELAKGDPPTVKTAQRAASLAGHDPVTAAEKPLADNFVHYALGSVIGIAYGVAAEYEPRVTAAGGTLLGAAVAVMLDELLVPSLGITPPPWRVGVKVHAYSAATHLLFGAAAEAGRHAVRTRFEPRR